MRSFPQDAAGRRTLLYGSTGCSLAAVSLLTIAWALTPYLHAVCGHVLDSLVSSISCSSCFARRWRPYTENIRTRSECSSHEDDCESASLTLDHDWTEKGASKPTMGLIKRLSILTLIFFMILLQFLRPNDSAYMYLSWTLPILPFADVGHDTGVDLTDSIVDHFLSKCDSLTPPSRFDWLPVNELAGFEDWYGDDNGTQLLHYDSARDCLHVSNLANRLLEPIAPAFRNNNVTVKHIILIKLESTRKDVFPLVKDNFMWKRVAYSQEDHHIPFEVEEGLGELTKNAEHLTGDYTGFEQQGQGKRVRGGLSASNAFTSASYTLKSITGTLCGITPLITDFNREYNHHIYQPCLAHIFEAFNRQITSDKKTDDFLSWPWQSVFMQSVTDDYDYQGPLLSVMGYNNTITKETLVDPGAAHFPPTSKDINYYGLPDTELKPYLRDAIQDAEKNQQRLFLTHLTGTTHHPWGLPEDFPYQDYMGPKGYGTDRRLDQYLNTIGFVDNWLGQILSVLEETGIANQTLLVLAGDHGTSLPDDGGNTPYDNPHVGNFHVPLIFSHPALPPVQIDTPVISTQILPTILDFLISSSSLSAPASKVASDLLPLYEGQSLLRPLATTSDADRAVWQFSVMNPGGSLLAVRSATASFRLVVPLVAEVEWRFTDLSSDPHELEPILTFAWLDLVSIVRRKYGSQAAEWVGEAARAAKWWVGENRRLWRWEEGDT